MQKKINTALAKQINAISGRDTYRMVSGTGDFENDPKTSDKIWNNHNLIGHIPFHPLPQEFNRSPPAATADQISRAPQRSARRTHGKIRRSTGNRMAGGAKKEHSERIMNL